MADPNASQTPSLALPLPVASHTLRVDVERLRDALMGIDTDLSDALEKLKTVWQDAGELNGTDLNALTADTQGSMYQADDSQDLLALNYPAQLPGTLLVLKTAIKGIASHMQLYLAYNEAEDHCEFYMRHAVIDGSNAPSFTPWNMIASHNWLIAQMGLGAKDGELIEQFDWGSHEFLTGEILHCNNNMLSAPAALNGMADYVIHCVSVLNDRVTLFVTTNSGPSYPVWYVNLPKDRQHRDPAAMIVRRLYSDLDKPSPQVIGAVPMKGDLGTTNLNTMNTMANLGVWFQSDATISADAARSDYPEKNVTGTLFIQPLDARGIHVSQLFVTSEGRFWYRSFDGSYYDDWISLATAGVNKDITKLEGLSGPLRLGGEGVDDNDAATIRQLRAATASTGQSAALINGVMNNFLGAVEWWNGVGTQLPNGYLKCSGQLLKRSDYPELWAAVAAGIFNTVTEALWQNAHPGDVNTNAENRVSFSTGTITTGPDANFRLPDLNGDQPGSIFGLFLRGLPDGQAAARGKAQLDGAPNITGSTDGNTDFGPPSANHGAIQTGNIAGVTMQTGGAGASSHAFNFDASRSYPGYGRSPGEIVPRSARGMWIIRVNGSFTAANTNFNVFRGVDTTPANGEVHYGGDLNSVFSVAGKNVQVVSVRGRVYQGGTEAAQIVIASNPTGSGTTKASVWEVGTAGELNAPNDAKAIFANKPICIPENQSISYARSEAPTTPLGMVKYDRPGNTVMLGNTVSQLQLYSSTVIKTGQPFQVDTWHYEGNNSANNGGAQITRVNGPGAGDFVIDDFFLATKQYWSRRSYITNGEGTNDRRTHIFEMRSTGSFVYSNSNNSGSPTSFWEIRGDANLVGSVWTDGTSNDLFGYINRHPSDRRLKDDIKPIELDEAKAFVQQHKTYSWTYKTNGHKGHGMIADELTPDLKYRVGTVAGLENVEAVNEGQLALAYLVPVMRDLMAQVEELKAEVAALRKLSPLVTE